MKFNGPNLSSPSCLFGLLTNTPTVLSHCSSMNSSMDIPGTPSWCPVWRNGKNWASIWSHYFCVYSSSTTDSITNFWSFHLASISYPSSSLFPLFLLIFQVVLLVLVSWPQYLLYIVTKNLRWQVPKAFFLYRITWYLLLFRSQR